MKRAIKSGVLGLAVIAALASSAANAYDSGWYLGANAGESAATIDDEGIARMLLGAGFTTVSIDDEDRDTGYKIFAGYRFNRYFALEGGYFDLGEFGYVATTLPVGTLTGNIQLRGVNIDAVGFMPFTDRFSLFARVGANYAEAEDTFVGTGFVNALQPTASASGTHIKYGVGLQYEFSESLALRAEAERYRIDDAVGNIGDVDLYSIGLVVGFGGGAEPYVAPRPEPAPMAPQQTCADLDDDRDGINNCGDKCPDSPAGEAIGADGCPVPAPEPEPYLEPKPFRG